MPNKQAKTKSLIKKILVLGNDFNSHFLVSYLTHYFPSDIKIIWIKPPNKVQNPILSLTPEILSFLKLINCPVHSFIGTARGNFKS